MTICWPGPADPRDAFADPAAAAPFAEAIARVWLGLCSLESLVDEARALGLDGPLPPGPRPPPAPRLPSDADLARLAADQDPAIGSFAPDRVLGPWADDADRDSLLAAVVHGAFVRGEGGEPSPAARHLRADRKHGADRAAVRPIERAPLAPWRLEGDRALPLLSIGAVPDGPVRANRARSPGEAWARPRVAHPTGAGGSVVFARMVLGPDGWVAVAPIAVPALPTAVHAWVRLLAWEERLVESCATLDELLARRGHTLLRRCLEDAW